MTVSSSPAGSWRWAVRPLGCSRKFGWSTAIASRQVRCWRFWNPASRKPPSSLRSFVRDRRSGGRAVQVPRGAGGGAGHRAGCAAGSASRSGRVARGAVRLRRRGNGRPGHARAGNDGGVLGPCHEHRSRAGRCQRNLRCAPGHAQPRSPGAGWPALHPELHSRLRRAAGAATGVRSAIRREDHAKRGPPRAAAGPDD